MGTLFLIYWFITYVITWVILFRALVVVSHVYINTISLAEIKDVVMFQESNFIQDAFNYGMY